jgi:hypothetical protein
MEVTAEMTIPFIRCSVQSFTSVFPIGIFLGQSLGWSNAKRSTASGITMLG